MQATPEALVAELNREFSVFGVGLLELDLQMVRSAEDIAELLKRKIQ